MSFNANFVSTPTNSLLSLSDLRWRHEEQPQLHRNPFSKDRDRILYSKSFLRLRGKTQVFMLQKNDYIRTRLTHSLEVNQLAKSIASALGQNMDLVEAIALGHDVGHTPFGHIGERTLSKLIEDDSAIPNNDKGFKHNLQALRLFCDLEKGADFPDYKGLNLTKYTLWGIAHHSSIPFKKDEEGKIIQPMQHTHPIYDMYLNEIEKYWSFEGYIVAIADEIAQRHHDIEDGLRYGIVTREELLSEIEKFSSLFSPAEKECIRRLNDGIHRLEEPVFNSLFSRLVINLYINDVIENSKQNLKQFGNKYNIQKQENFKSVRLSLQEEDYKDCIALSSELDALDKGFQQYLKEHMLNSYQAQAMDGKARYIIRKLYKACIDNPLQLPDTSIFSYACFINLATDKRSEVIEKLKGHEDILHRCVADYIGGMTDQYAYNEFDRLYGTKV